MITTVGEAHAEMLDWFSQPDCKLTTESAVIGGGGGGCDYRGANGTKCAVGCLIPDEVYREEWENNRVGDIMPELINAGIFGGDVQLSRFLDDAQQVHDARVENAQQFVDWLNRLNLDQYQGELE